MTSDDIDLGRPPLPEGAGDPAIDAMIDGFAAGICDVPECFDRAWDETPTGRELCRHHLEVREGERRP